MTSQNEPRLAPPGAGVPLTQKIFLRFFVRPFIAEKNSWEKSKESFEKVTAKILNEVEGLSEAQLNQKVLVPPQQGLEDSSRFWSVAMVLEHMAIAGRRFIGPIESLTHGKIPQEVLDPASVKPSGQLTAQECVEDFKKFALQEFPKIKVGDRNSQLKLFHPWFGPMTAQAWYWLLGPHQYLHLKQIRTIKKGLQSQ